MPAGKIKTHRNIVETLLNGIGRVLLRPVFLFFLRAEVVYDRSVSYLGPYIIAANHPGKLDPVALGSLLPRKWKLYPLKFAAGKWAMGLPFWSRLFRLAGAFALRKGDGLAKAIEEPVALLKHGRSILMFPQGHINLGFKVEEGRKGSAAIAMVSDKPILPIALCGIAQTSFWDFVLRKRKLIVLIGHPLPLKRDPSKPLEQDAREKTILLMRELEKLYCHAETLSAKN